MSEKVFIDFLLWKQLNLDEQPPELPLRTEHDWIEVNQIESETSSSHFIKPLRLLKFLFST